MCDWFLFFGGAGFGFGLRSGGFGSGACGCGSLGFGSCGGFGCGYLGLLGLPGGFLLGRGLGFGLLGQVVELLDEFVAREDGLFEVIVKLDGVGGAAFFSPCWRGQGCTFSTAGPGSGAGSRASRR